jgi:hypothetical protein
MERERRPNVAPSFVSCLWSTSTGDGAQTCEPGGCFFVNKEICCIYSS